MNHAISKAEREDLQRLIRQREKVMKSAAKQRSAELLADFENQMGSEVPLRSRRGLGEGHRSRPARSQEGANASGRQVP
jgi:hypothetical protein